VHVTLLLKIVEQKTEKIGVVSNGITSMPDTGFEILAVVPITEYGLLGCDTA
jgi:hypothetical protein